MSANRLPQALLSELASSKVPESHIEEVVCEHSPKCPWIVSLNREKRGGPETYATVRPGVFRVFDSFDEALKDAGGQEAMPGTGNFYELVEIIEKGPEQNQLAGHFKPPITFVGQISDLILLTAPAGMLLSGQARQLRDAANVALGAATRSGAIPKDAKLQMFMVPEGVKLCRLVERKS